MAAHAYWRIRETSTQASLNKQQFVEITFVDEAGVAISMVGGTPFSSQAPDTGSALANAFDGDIGTSFTTAQTFSAAGSSITVGMQFASPVEVFGVQLTGGTGWGPTGFALEHSDNGALWTTDNAWSGFTLSNGVTDTFMLPDPTDPSSLMALDRYSGDVPIPATIPAGTNLPYRMSAKGGPTLITPIAGATVEGEIDESMEFSDSSTGATPTYFEDEIDEGFEATDLADAGRRREMFDNTYLDMSDAVVGEIAENPLSGVIEENFEFSTRLGETFDETLYEWFFYIQDTIDGDTGDTYDELLESSFNSMDAVTPEVRPGVRAAEVLQFTEVVIDQWAKSITERLRLASPATGNFIITLLARENTGFRDRLRIIVPVTLIEAVGIEAVGTALSAVRIAERLGLTDALVAKARRVGNVAEKLRFRDSLRNFFGAEVMELLGVDDDVEAVLHAMTTLLEVVDLEATVTPMVAFRAIVRDRVALDDGTLQTMIWNGLVEDAFEFAISYFGVDGEYTGWAMNTRTSAVTEYSNYQFNSFARMGNIYLGASADGLYELRGDDDSGEDVASLLRGGFMRFGGTKLSRLKAAYIAMRAPNSEVLLKIETADGLEYVYQIDTRSMRNSKVDMGKGQRAVYFTYELQTIGQDFDLDTIEFVPIVMQRRV